MKRTLLFGSVGMMALIMASPSQTAGKTKSEQALDRLTSPEGGPEMITMFTVDGDHLIATHYCAAKNQPQMTTSAITDAQKPLVFSIARITGLKSPGDFHNTGLTLTLEDTGHLTQIWTYESKGKKG